MAKFKLIGVKEVNFTNSEGVHISGVNLFVGHSDEHTTGMMTDKFFVKSEIEIPQIKIGDDINIVFNQRGRVEGITKG